MEDFAIETDRLVLRPFKLSDTDNYFAMTQDKDIREYVPYACAQSLEETRENIEDYSKGDLKHDYYLVLECKKTQRIVGALIVTQNPKLEFDFCIIIAKEQRRKGYMTEAIKAFIKVFPSKSVLRWDIRSDNMASLQTIKKIQGVYEADSMKGIGEDGTVFRIFKYIVP